MPDLELWAIYPARHGIKSLSARQQLRKQCNAREWDFQERPSVVAKPPGKTLEILRGPDTTEIYRRAHRVHIGVVIFSPTFVCLHPDEKEALNKNQIARLQTFLAYKCFVRLCDDSTVFSAEWADEIATAFLTHSAAIHCEGERDPRCLPLHVFKNSGNLALGTPSGRSQFDAQYGNGQKRTDSNKRGWELSPHLFHGTEDLHVAGRQLRTGYHWDVTPGGDSTLIVTTSQMWKVRGYINVYPDSNLRVTSKSKATQII